MGRKMKDSGVEWIGEIPEEWQICKLKYCVNHITERSENNENYIGLENVESWTGKYIESDSLQIDGTALRFNENDVLFGKLRPYLGKCIVADKKGACSTEFIVMSSYKIKSNYLKNIILTSQFIDEVNMSTYGAKMPRANWDFISNIFIPVPTKNDEEKIINIVDMINKEFITAKEKISQSIEAYKSLKQSLITHAVTKGVRGKREMKGSGSQWFGEIPEKWQMMRIKYLFHIQKDIAGEEGYTVLSITQRGIKIKDLSKNEGQLAANYSNYQLVHKGDFAMNHMDLLTGWVDISEFEGVTSPDYRVFVLDDKLQNYDRYYLYMMQMCYTNRIFYGLGQGVSGLGRWRLQADKFSNFEVPVPPKNEQREIAAYLDKKCTAIDNLIAKKEQLLTELEAYKKSLIYEYVTGKREISE